MTTASGGWAVPLHHIVLRLAGWAPDEMICTVRDWLAEDRVADVAQAVLYTALANRIPVTRNDATVLTGALADAGLEADAHALLDLVAYPQLPHYTMSPEHPARHGDDDGEFRHSLDLTGLPGEHDAVDRAAIGAAAGIAGLRGLWRAWRSPAFVTPSPPPRRVYLLQVDCEDASALPSYAARLQHALVRVGDKHPQVEVFVEADALPPYQRLGLGWSALLATSDPTPPIQLAGLFDAVDDAGEPGFSGDRPTLDDGERDRVLGFLDAGALLLPTTTLMDDVLEDAGHPVVPMGFRTDGVWVWPEATAYFLRQHHIAPDDDLLDHVRRQRYQAAPAGAVALHRAMAALEAEYGDE
ncbi:MAG: hypothetical protein ACRDT4_04120 [Micromonosporaceae bacterium]